PPAFLYDIEKGEGKCLDHKHSCLMNSSYRQKKRKSTAESEASQFVYNHGKFRVFVHKPFKKYHEYAH
ncbi:MAG: hypothetical protein SO072_09140, partial [Dysosmobacter sp.]|nr:hypothetical protein [Dysosmobacter sp.]